jgi:predicted amidohydrolase YtcJ
VVRALEVGMATARGSAGSREPASSYADLVLLAGRVLTLAAAAEPMEGLAVREGRIVALGDSATLREHVGPTTEIVDLRGRTVLPGFIDSHNHMLWAGLTVIRPALDQARSVDDVLGIVARAAAERPAGEWIVAAPAWHVHDLRERRHPTRHELDRVAPLHPVFLASYVHDASVNTAALACCGIDARTPDPDGGSIERDESTGEPTGVLREGPALWLVEQHVPSLTTAEMARAIAVMGQCYWEAGLTSILDPALTPREMRAYSYLWRTGDLPLRTTMLLRLDAEPGLAPGLALLDDWGVASGFGDDSLKLGGVKVFLDGAITKGAGMLETPYADSPHPTGIQAMDGDTLLALVRRAHEYGWQFTAHSSGDRAVRVLLDAYETVHHEQPLADRRFQAIHAHLSRPEDRARARALGVVVVPQPVAISRAAWTGILAPGEADRLWPLRSYLAEGVHVAGSSDAPLHPYQPLRGIWSAVTRQVEASGAVHAPEQRLSRLEALRLFTQGGAYATFDEARKGTLEAGKLADLVVLGEDPLTCPEADLKDLPVLLTAVGGRIVHRSPELA